MDGGLRPSTPAVRAPLLPRTRSHATSRNAGIGNEVEQVVEPAMRIIASPTVQLGLDLQYPALGSIEAVLQFVGIHRRPPDIPVSTADLLAPFALRPAFPAPVAGRHSRDYYEASAPSAATAGNEPAHRRAGARQTGRPRMVPTFTTQSIGQGGAQLYSGSIATTTPQAFTVASPPEQDPAWS